MKYYDNLTDTNGNTPMIVINNITKHLQCKVYAKYETFNPGNSVRTGLVLK